MRTEQTDVRSAISVAVTPYHEHNRSNLTRDSFQLGLVRGSPVVFVAREGCLLPTPN